jgi:preprotein translocase subunit SecG
MVARLLAVSALLIATCIVLAVLLEASEPNPASSVPRIKPLPQNLFSP